jgi:hypothetical protein
MILGRWRATERVVACLISTKAKARLPVARQTREGSLFRDPDWLRRDFIPVGRVIFCYQVTTVANVTPCSRESRVAPFSPGAP